MAHIKTAGCIGCAAADRLGITDDRGVTLVHALTMHIIEYSQIQAEAEELGLELAAEPSPIDVIGEVIEEHLAAAEESNHSTHH